MFESIRQWLLKPWAEQQPDVLLNAYQITFNNIQGQMVLHDLIDKFYAVVAPIDNQVALARHCGQREVVHAILVNLEMAKSPEKFRPKVLSK